MNMLMELELTVKKHTNVFKTICAKNTRVIKDIVNNQHISFPGARDKYYFSRIKLHMVSGKRVLHRVNI
jgi:hypothetical protein